MTTTGDVQITITESGAGAVVVPAASVQVVLGCSTAGSVGSVVATRNPTTLRNALGYGPLVEAAALSCAAGGTVLAMRVPMSTPGTVNGVGASVAVNTTTGDTVTPIVVTADDGHGAPGPHGLHNGDVVTISGVTGNTAANGTFVIHVVTANTFSLIGATGNGAYVSGGSFHSTGVKYNPNTSGMAYSAVTLPGLSGFTFGTEGAGGTSIPTVTLDSTNGAFDDYYVALAITTGGTVGTPGIRYRLSLDAGRTFGPTTALLAANTIAIAGTGITINLAAGTLLAGDYIVFSTTGMAWAAAGVQTVLTALQASPYAITGWGSMHIVGVAAESDAASIQGYLDTLGTNFLFTRAMLSARDASPPIVWGGTGETDTAYVSSLGTAFQSLSAKRLLVGSGFYNMPSAFGGFGSPRRCITWAQAAREVVIPPQRHSGRVRDGALSQVNLDAANDPLDGFVYHDERINPSLDGMRFCSARTRVGLQGLFIANPNLMSPAGSDFTLLPLGAVMDVACTIVHAEGQLLINSDVKLNANGTLYEPEAKDIENAILGVLNTDMANVGMISSAAVQVDRTTNVKTAKKVVITVTIVARGYVLEEDVSIGFSGANAAA